MSIFQKTCVNFIGVMSGEPAVHIVIQDENRQVRTAELNADLSRVTFGSDPDCHVYLPDVRIAEQHFQLYLDNSNGSPAWRVHKLEVEEGSGAEFTRMYVNAIDVTENQQLRHNDEILISRFRLKLFLEDLGDTPQAAIIATAAKIRSFPLPPGALMRANSPEQYILRGDACWPLTNFAFDVHECRDFNCLMTRSVQMTLKLFRARQVWLGVRQRSYGRLEFVESLNADGKSSDEPPHLETYEFRCVERGQAICLPQTEDPDTESALVAPLLAGRGLLGMLYVDNKPGAAPYSEEDLDLLTVLASIIARQVELLVEDQLKLQEVIGAGVQSIIRDLQGRMDPKSVPQWPGLQLAVYCKPGLDVAGDVYDVMRMPNGLAAFVCGHVVGKPTPVAMAMTELRAAFRFAGLHADPPHVFMRALNWLLHDAHDPCRFSGLGLVMNTKTGALQFAPAGEARGVIVGARGAIRSLARSGSPDVGTSKDFLYKSESGRLAEGETLVLYTPGCLSAVDKDGLRIDEEDFLESVSDSFEQPASTTLDELMGDFKAYFRDGRCADDMTIMVVHRE